MSKKVYGIQGKEIEIKFKDTINYDRVLFKIMYPDAIEPCYYIPKHIFPTSMDVTTHILDNLETSGLVIEVIKCNPKEIKY